MTKPNLPGCEETPAMTMPRGSNSGAKRSRSSVSERRFGGAVTGAGSAAISTSASTATGSPPRNINGFTSTLAMSPRSAPSRPSPTRTSAMASTLPAGSPRNGFVTRWLARRRPIRATASACVSGAAANATSPSASVRMPPSPIATHGPNCGSRTRPTISSRLAETISPIRMPTWSVPVPTGPSSGRTSARRSATAASTAAASPRPRRTPSRSLLWAILRPQSLATTGNPIRSAAATAPAASVTRASAAAGTP